MKKHRVRITQTPGPGYGRLVGVALIATFLPGCLSLLPTAALPPAGTYVPGQLLVEFAAGTSLARMRQEQQSAGATPAKQLASDIWSASVSSGAETRALQSLDRDHDVLHAEPALTIHDDMVGGFTPGPVYGTAPSPGYRVQYTIPNPLYPPSGGLPGQWGVTQVEAPQAWDQGALGNGVEVAVVDTGADVGHPDLVNNLDLKNAANYYDPDKNTLPIDDFGHGTHVAGIIAAQLGTFGTVGVAPQAHVIPIRVMGVEGGTTANVIAGLDHVLQTPARIVNLSLGSTEPSAVEQDEIDKLEQAGILVVAAAGNEALDGNPLEYPASYPGVVSVAATRIVDSSNGSNIQTEHADFSNFNPFVSVAAPGVDILSTVPRQLANGAAASTPDEGAYAYASGTSMATPMVSGVAALILSAHPTWSAAQVKAQLLATAGEPPTANTGFNSFFGYGVVNALAAVTR